MLISVIGASGYLGSVLCRQLLDNDLKVRAIDPRPLPNNLGIEPQSIEYFQSRLETEKECLLAVASADVVVYLAGIVGDRECINNPEDARNLNYFLPSKISGIASRTGCKRFIYVSTSSVYGNTVEPATESYPVITTSLYQETKVAAERWLLTNLRDGCDPIILRLASLFGWSPSLRNNSFVHEFLRQALETRSIEVRGGSAWRPIFHVVDAADAIVTVISKKLQDNVLNIGDDHLNVRKIEVANAIADEIQGTKVVETAQTDSRSYIVSFERFHNTGFRPRFGLRDGLRGLISS